MVSSTLGIGLVGLGDIARKRYLPQILGSEHTRLVAVCSKHESSLGAVTSSTGCDRWYSDVHELVAQPDVDAVIVATPHPLHAEGAVAALAADKHVLIEKPLCTRLEDALAIADAARGSTAVAMALPWKQGSIDALVLEVLRRGVLGKIVSIRVVNGVNGPQYKAGSRDPEWAFKARAGGGALLGHGVYSLARIAELVGPATSVAAKMALLRPQRHIASVNASVAMEVEDYCVLSLEVSTGQDITLECGWTYGRPCDTLAITGTDGVLMSPGRFSAYVQGHQAEHDATLSELGFSFDDVNKVASVGVPELLSLQPTPTVVDDFVEAILAGAAPSGNLERAVHTTEQMTAAYESHARGGIRIPLETTFAPSSGLPQDLFAIADLRVGSLAAAGTSLA